MANNTDLDETVYEQDPAEIEAAYRTTRGDFIVDVEEEEREGEEGSNEEEESVDEEDTTSESNEDTQDEEKSASLSRNDEDIDEVDTPKIPRSRLNKVIEQREELKDRVSWLEEQLEKFIEGKSPPKRVEPERSEYDFDLAESKYIDLILEGDSKTATALRREINEERAYLFKQEINTVKEEARQHAKEEASATLEGGRFDTLVNSYEQKYPFLDVESKEYNEDALDTVNSLMVGYIKDKGMNQIEALTKAINKIVPMFTKDVKQSLGQKRTDTAKTKALEAAKKQPIKQQTSIKEDKISVADLNVSKMTEKQFNKLTAEERAILRGDILG